MQFTPKKKKKSGKLHFWTSEIVFILVPKVWDFSFWPNNYDSVFKIVILSISKSRTNLVINCYKTMLFSLSLSLSLSLIATRLVTDMDERTTLKTKSNLMDQIIKSQTLRTKMKVTQNFLGQVYLVFVFFGLNLWRDSM